MSEFLLPLIVVVVIAAGVYFLRKKTAKPAEVIHPEEPVILQPVVTPVANTKPLPLAADKPDDQQLHPSWKALGIGWTSVLMSGLNPRDPAPERFYTYKPPVMRKEKDTSKNVFTPESKGLGFDRKMIDGNSIVFQLKAEGPVTVKSAPWSGEGLPEKNDNGSITLTIKDKSGVVVDTHTGDALQARVKVQSPGDYTVEAVTKGYTGGIRFETQ